MRTAASVLQAYGATDPTVDVTDAMLQVPIALLLHKRGLHEQFLEALVEETGAIPPIIASALSALMAAADPAYTGPPRIDVSSLDESV